MTNFTLAGIENEIFFANNPSFDALFLNLNKVPANSLSILQLVSFHNTNINIVYNVYYNVITSKITKEKSILFPYTINALSTVNTSFDCVLIFNQIQTLDILRLQTPEIINLKANKPIKIKIPNLKLKFK